MLALVLSSLSVVSAVHGIVPRVEGLAMCRRFAAASPPDPIQQASLVKARLALEHPSTFVVLGLPDEEDDRDSMVMYICTPVGTEVHRVDAILWPEASDHILLMRRFRRWHHHEFRTTCLLPGALSPEDSAAWR